jgi:hypothetical protein
VGGTGRIQHRPLDQQHHRVQAVGVARGQVLATRRDLAELDSRLAREIGACRGRISINEVNTGLVGRIGEMNASLVRGSSR